MKVMATETFKKKFESPVEKPSHHRVEALRLAVGKVYNFYFLPKVDVFDEATEEIKIDYPFEEIATHYGLSDILKQHMNSNPYRVNCLNTDCELCSHLEKGRVDVDVFKALVPSKHFISYVVIDKVVKALWIPEYRGKYLYTELKTAMSSYMAKHEIDLESVLKHRIKVFTNSENKITFEIEEKIWDWTTGAHLFKFVYNNPISDLIAMELTPKPQVTRVFEKFKELYDNSIQAKKKRLETDPHWTDKEDVAPEQPSTPTRTGSDDIVVETRVNEPINDADEEEFRKELEGITPEEGGPF